jgi:hypothetical protein
MLERAVVGMPSPSALLSLARWSGRTLDEVREYAKRDCIGDLIVETRVARGEPRTGITPLVAYETLRRRQELYVRMLRWAGDA